MILRELIDQVKIENIAGDQINPATDEKLDELNNKDFSTETTLSAVLSQLDITLSALRDSIKGAGDKDFSTLQTEIESILAKLDVDLSTRASDSTLQSLLNATGETSGTSILNELQSILSRLDVALSSRASETTLSDVKTNLDDIKIQLDTLNATDFSTEATLSSVLNAIGESSGVDVLSILQNIDAKDFATQTTLALIKVAIDTINSNVDVVLSSRASESTLALIKTAIDAINSDIDVVLSSRASEVTLVLVKTNLDDIKIQLDTLIAKDFATESTSQEILQTIGQESGSTVLSKLQNIWDKLASLFTDGLAKVKIWDGVETTNVTTDNRLEVDTGVGKPGLSTSAFGLVKVAPEAMLANFRWTTNLINNGFSEDLISSGSAGSWSIVETSVLELKTDAFTASGIDLQSLKDYYYQSGRGQLFRISIILGDSGVAGNIREWGLSNSLNGVFIRLNGTEYEFVLRSDGVETIVTAPNWDTAVTPDENGHIWYIQYQWLGVGNFFVYYDGVLVYTHRFLGTSTSVSMENPDLPVRLRNYNTSNTSDVSLKTGCCSVINEGANIISGLDENDILREIRVTASGRLKVDSSPPDAPIDTIAVVITEFDNVTSTDDNNYIIPPGETLVIQRFSAGAEVDTTAGNAIEVWHDPNGTGIGMEIIDVIFSSGTSDQHDLRSEFVGDGTAQIKMRRKRYSGGAKEIFGRWEGYLEP